jgi:hypothetical protein
MLPVHKISLLVVTTTLLALAATPVSGQSQAPEIIPENWSGAGGAYYDLASPTAVVDHVHVWGNLGRPGIYKIPRGTRLSTLYTAAGGPTAGPQTPQQRQDTRLRLLRPNGEGYEVIYETRFRNHPPPFVDDPIMRNGDVVSVETRVTQALHWREVLTTVSSLATFYLLMDRLITGRRR